VWVLSTLSVLVLLFGYNTSTDSPATAPPAVHSGATTDGSAGSTGSGTGSTGSGTGTTVTGRVASTRWGPVQVELVLSGGAISAVDVVQYPSGNPKDAEINDYALPILTQETVDAQSADIDMVSGATVTSEGYVESLQSAIDQAGL